MATEPTQAPTSPTPSVPDSPWVAFLMGKNTSADRFLKDMAAGVILIPDETTGKPTRKSTGAITIPDEVTRNQFVDALAAKLERIERLVSLLQAPASSQDPIRRIVVELAELSIKRLGIITLPEPLDAVAFGQLVSSWLTSIQERPLKSVKLNTLFLLLHFGWRRQLLDQDLAITLITSAASKPIKLRSTPAQPVQPTPALLDVVLAAGPTEPLLSSLMAYLSASKITKDKLTTQLQSQAMDIANFTAECDHLNAIITSLRLELATLQAQKTAADGTIADLEKQIVDMRDGYQHKLNDLRGRMRGMLQGQLTRWLQTALDASQSDPPWITAIQERLEDALKLIEKEIQWLQPSA